MPELPEVETVRAYIHQYTAGKKIMHIDVRLARLIKNADADTFIHALTGQTIEAVKRRGKYLLLQCSGSHSLLVHLRMTGSLIYVPHWQENIKAAHIIFSLQEGTLVYRDIRTLGCLWLVPPQGPTGIQGYDTLGPDGNSPACTTAYLRQALAGTQRYIKSFLLDQTKIAGLGNIYVDEALFLAHISPFRRCHTLTQEEIEHLHDAIVHVLHEGLKYGGTTIQNFVNGSGREGQNQNHLLVYGREGTPCVFCGGTIQYKKLTGRGTHYCPHCQH